MRDDILRVVGELGQKQRQAFINHDFKTWEKGDKSPVTDVDHYSHRFLMEVLSGSGLPVISEEDEDTWHPTDDYWVIDPLDGTREFVNNIDEFTINIARIEAGVPTFGVVHHPISGATYWAESKAYKIVGGQTTTLRVKNHAAPARILLSRYHTKEPPKLDFAHEYIRCGSSLKFPRIAENLADIYPRKFNMYQWDTAAGVAIVRGAGGVVINHAGEDLYYTKNIRSEGFVAANNKALALQTIPFLAD